MNKEEITLRIRAIKAENKGLEYRVKYLQTRMNKLKRKRIGR